MTKKKRYKRYSPEFKREALMRASEEGVTDVIVCEELDISAGNCVVGEMSSGFWEMMHSRARGKAGTRS